VTAQAAADNPVQTTAELLATVVDGIGGAPREGQQQMAAVVARAFASGTHVLVQAGTGTGKSVGYLVPSIVHVRSGGKPVVVATATLALQHQLVHRDLPAINDALRAAGEDEVSFAVLKGRSNYLCRQRLADPVDDPGQQLDFDTGVGLGSRLERQAAEVREWAQTTSTGDRDEIEDVDARVWRAFSVTSRECVGAAKCQFGADCFAELARTTAGEADIVVTNHALLALHAVEQIPLLPEHDAVVVDEGHELVDRATSAITGELAPTGITRALTGARRSISAEASELVDDAVAALSDALFDLDGRLVTLPDAVAAALGAVRDATSTVLSELTATRGDAAADPDAVARLARARSAVEDVHDIAGTILGADENSVVWVSRGAAGRYPSLHVAPLSVAGALRAGLLDEASVVLTSATLTLGGDFGFVAQGVGLSSSDRDAEGPGGWTAVDVGSPFDFARQGILYVAADLPRPGRDGPSPEALDAMVELVAAAGGRALVLYSSWRGVEAAAERLEQADLGDIDVLVQRRGDSVGPLVRRFTQQPTSVLVGTLSLWQGVDVSGDSCILVVIDRIPFPRPDDPLLSARADRVSAAGGNGFTAVSVPRAALMLAQGAGRLIRSSSDRGVVAVLDQRLVRAGYGRALLRSMPPLWLTTDRSTTTGALQRLAQASGPTAGAR
jgi:ATP-dependent DNA helicase DinG